MSLKMIDCDENQIKATKNYSYYYFCVSYSIHVPMQERYCGIGYKTGNRN